MHGSCDVNFSNSKDEDVWATISFNNLQKICGGKLTSIKQIHKAIEAVGECEIVEERKIIQEIVFQQDEDKENEGKEKEEEKNNMVVEQEEEDVIQMKNKEKKDVDTMDEEA